MIICVECGGFLDSNNAARCVACRSTYHLTCALIDPAERVRIKWPCPTYDLERHIICPQLFMCRSMPPRPIDFRPMESRPLGPRALRAMVTRPVATMSTGIHFIEPTPMRPRPMLHRPMLYRPAAPAALWSRPVAPTPIEARSELPTPMGPRAFAPTAMGSMGLDAPLIMDSRPVMPNYMLLRPNMVFAGPRSRARTPVTFRPNEPIPVSARLIRPRPIRPIPIRPRPVAPIYMPPRSDASLTLRSGVWPQAPPFRPHAPLFGQDQAVPEVPGPDDILELLGDVDNNEEIDMADFN